MKVEGCAFFPGSSDRPTGGTGYLQANSVEECSTLSCVRGRSQEYKLQCVVSVFTCDFLLGFSRGQIQNELSGPELPNESYFGSLHQKPVLA